MNLVDFAARWRKDSDAYRRLFMPEITLQCGLNLSSDVVMAIHGQHPALADTYLECADMIGTRESVAEAQHLVDMLHAKAHDETVKSRAARQRGEPWGIHLSKLTAYRLCAYELTRWIKRGGQ